jgi:WD40 repeat protein
VANRDRAAVALYEVAEGAREKWSATMTQVLFAAASPDGRWVAAGSLEGGTGVRVWEADSGRLEKELLIGDADVVFSPNGRWLYTTTGRASPGGAELRAWRTGAWESGPGLALDRTSSAPTGLAVSPDGRTVAVSVAQDGVRLLDAETFAEIGTLTAPETGLVGLIQFSPDGSTLAVGASQFIHLWDLRRLRRELATVGLDWDASPSAAGPGPPPQPLRVVVDLGEPGNSPAPASR